MTRLLAAALAATALLVASPAFAEEGKPRASDLEAQFVCPTCKATLDQSDAPIARRMKAYIRQRLDEGATAEQIKGELVEQFGPRVLSVPPKKGFDLLAWVLPLGGLGIGAVVLGALAWSWSRRRGQDDDPADAAPVDEALDRRVDEALARFDA